MWLPWEYALVLVVVFALLGRRLHATRPRLAAVAREASIVSVLYSLWQLAGQLSLLGIERALERGAWLWDFERTLRLPNEQVWQAALIPHSFWTQAANLYYAIAHVPAMGVFLVWAFLRHNDRYRPWRNTLALVTGTAPLSSADVDARPFRTTS